MGRCARASAWKKERPWQGLAHPHAGRYGLLGVLVDGVPPGVTCTILLAVGPAGAQQIAATLTVVGSGEARFAKPINLRDGVPLWYKASLPDVNAATRTADIVQTAAERNVERLAETLGKTGGVQGIGTGGRLLVGGSGRGTGRAQAAAADVIADTIAGYGLMTRTLRKAADKVLTRPSTEIDDQEAI